MKPLLVFLARLLLLMAAVLISLLFALSCMTFSKAKRRYATTVTDTTYQTVRLTVPHDSIVHVMHHDTTYHTNVYTERYVQGRARLAISHGPTSTTIRADCDSATVQKVVATHVENNTWGVSKHYKTATGVLAFLVLAGVLAYVFMHLLQLNISKR